LFLSITAFFLVFLFGAFSSAKEKPKLSPKYKKWIEEEVVYIITPAEKEVFTTLETDRERDLFIKEFWRQRDPTPGTPKNEFKEEHYRRIEYVSNTTWWGQNKKVNSWRTNRGRIYITLGKPHHIARFSSALIYPIEIWYYSGSPKYGQPGNFRLLFFKKHGVGEFELYDPVSDGPKSLAPFTWTANGLSTDEEKDEYAYSVLQSVSVELAAASVSFFSGHGMSVSQGGASWSYTWMDRVPSAVLLSEVHTYPHKKVEDSYAYEFLERKASVEVSYSIHNIGSLSRVDVIRAPSGHSFIHYAIEPELFSVDQFENRYLANFKANIRVTDLEEKTIFQKEMNFPIEMKNEQMKNIEKRPFHLYDNFPIIPGDYKFNLLLENTVSKEFTSIEKDLHVPEPDSLWISPLILANRMNPDSPFSQFNKTFKTGNLQLYPSLNKKFIQKDKLYLFFQIYGQSPLLQEKGILEFSFYRKEELFQTRRKKLTEYTDKQNILEEILLEEFPVGTYQIKVSLLDEEETCVLSCQEDFYVHENSLPESWIINQTYPSLDDPIYLASLGSQYINKGKMIKGRNELEKAYTNKNDSIEYALNFTRALLPLNEYEKTKEVLTPFLDSHEEKYILYKFLGMAHQGLGEYEKAIDFYLQYISHQGSSCDILNSIALCYYQSGNIKEALRAWEKSLEINPNQEELKKKVKELKKQFLPSL
ncbi:MAG: GWxTD domain-containing protein, partial [Acidobacteriota bacterium]